MTAPGRGRGGKVAAGEAAYAAARTALQLHGAIGYTAEYDLSLWLTKARALRTAWGSPTSAGPPSSVVVIAARDLPVLLDRRLLDPRVGLGWPPCRSR